MAEETEAAEATEPWILQTQATLGARIARPRMLPERLRKPPFRFLFDATAEVARQTSFGAAELFGGDPGPKPEPPQKREEKVEFLQRWIAVVAGALPEQAEALSQVSAVDVVCGANPDKTNFVLQCLATAAFPEVAEAGPPEENASDLPQVPAAPAEKPEEENSPPPVPQAEAGPVSEVRLQLPGEVPLEATPLSPEEEAERREKAQQEAMTAMRAAAEQAPDVLAAIAAADKAAAAAKAAEEELARMKAQKASAAPTEGGEASPVPDIDFDSALHELGNLQQEFERTAIAWNSRDPPPPPAMDSDDSGSEEDLVPAPPPDIGEDEDQEHRFASTAMLFNAKERVHKVNEELTRAQDLLASIEDALDQKDAEIQQWKDLEDQRRDAEVVAADAKARAEEAEEEQRRLEKAARKAKRKAAKQAEKERAAQQAKEAVPEASEAPAVLYPVSKTSQLQGARLVSCVGGEPVEDDKYEWDGDEASGKPVEEEEEVPAPPPPRADGMDACFGEDILGPGETTLEPSACGAPAHLDEGQLFEQIKAEMCDTFVSYLCASLPTSLLKKYSASELVGCLQILLQELRGILSEKDLEDLLEEEPTSVAEELRKGSPLGWLAYLQSISPQTLCSRFDVSELVDTLQALCQTAFDRLVDELGPMQRWVSEESRLYVAPTPAPPPAPADATSERPATAAGQASASRPLASTTQAETWSAELHDAPWQAPPRSPAPASNDMPPPSRSGPAPVFNATLGPAPWEMNLQGPAPATAAPRMATGSRLATGGRPATQVSAAKALLSR